MARTMARHAQPRELAELKGAHKKDPQRYRGDVPKHSMPIEDKPPEYLSEEEAECWFELCSRAIPGVLTYTDGPTMGMLAVLLAEFKQRKADFPAAKIGQLRGLLGQMGFTVADRQKLRVDKKEERDTFEDL